MDRETRKRLHSPTEDSDRVIQQAVRQRAAQQVTNLTAPTLPGTGTDRVAALLAAARRDRNEAFSAARRSQVRTSPSDDRPDGV